MIWQRAQVNRKCGSCGKPIPMGEPVLFVSAAHLSRCVSCANSQYQTTPPDTLEPLRTPEAPKLQPFTSTRTLVEKFDPKQAQVGKERE